MKYIGPNKVKFWNIFNQVWNVIDFNEVREEDVTLEQWQSLSSEERDYITEKLVEIDKRRSENRAHYIYLYNNQGRVAAENWAKANNYGY